LEVACAREPIADCQFRLVPFWSILVVRLVFGLLRALLQNVLDVLINDEVNGAVIDLTELVLTRGAEIDDQTTAEVVLHFDHVARHLTFGASNELLGELADRLGISEVALVCLFKDLGRVLLSRLLVESDGEDVILHCVKKLGQSGHVHCDLLLEVVRAVHVFKDVLRHEEQLVVRVLDGDLVTFDRLDFKVGRLREPLFFLKLLRIPERLASALDFLCSCSFFATSGASSDSRTKDERGSGNELFGYLSLRLCGAGSRQVGDNHDFAILLVILLHYLYHLVAISIYFDECEADSALGKLAHLVLDLEAIRAAVRVTVPTPIVVA